MNAMGWICRSQNNVLPFRRGSNRAWVDFYDDADGGDEALPVVE